ncbi:hypothetical protein XELAEV_18028690mg [Xenopus laevis]|uniref:Uncharacterized protein n=1 Tax=Xenopus laevis TaxID=8355 RepID=A0A974HH34_XENLA|nr:hypothetical protein XELAEV_18028690mg [Xenopus laevis]
MLELSTHGPKICVYGQLGQTFKVPSSYPYMLGKLPSEGADRCFVLVQVSVWTTSRMRQAGVLVPVRVKLKAQYHEATGKCLSWSQ